MLDEQLNTLKEQISEAMVAFDNACQALRTIPGIGEQSAHVMIAEIGVDMTVFADAVQLASWAGVSWAERVGWMATLFAYSRWQRVFVGGVGDCCAGGDQAQGIFPSRQVSALVSLTER